MFGEGRNLLASLTYKGKVYNYCLFWDSELQHLNTQFIEGDFNVASPTLLLATPWIQLPTTQDFNQVVLDALGLLNAFLLKQFGGVPVTWLEQLEAVFRKVVFYLDKDGIPQAKINE
jgi:hypothetical protein